MSLDIQSRGFRAIFALALTAGCATGCSLLLHSDASQCSIDSDCVARGFTTDTTCEVATGTCVAKSKSDGGTGVSCQKYSDCPQPTGGSQQIVACDVDTNTCIQVTSEECPFVIGDYMDTPAPVFIGAFATIPTSGPMTDPSYENYALAQGDFASMGGVELAPALGGLRMPVVVVCDNTADTSVVMRHLINDVHIAVLVADLDTTPLLTTFSSVNNGDASAPTVLFINPFGSNDTFARVNTRSLLWSLLGQPSDVTQAYQAFFPWVEAYVRKTQNLVATDDGGALPPMRVATVTSASTDPQQLSDAVIPILTWGGGPATLSSNPNYLGITMDASELNADASATKINTAVGKAVTQLIAFKPNVVVSFAGDEFDSVLEDVDLEWTTSTMGPKPFYLIGPFNSASGSLLEWSNDSASNRSRLAGVTFADAPGNYPVLVNYEQEFVSTYSGTLTTAGYYSNYYDAMYYAVYSLAAAGPKLTGTNAAEGMLDLTNTVPPATRSYDMGPAGIAGVESALGAPGTPVVSLNGTLGPPTFNRATGARVGQGDVYCADLADNGPTWAYDVLRLEAADGGSPLDGAPLEGTFPCFDGMAPPP
jgi:hypothetical protein